MRVVQLICGVLLAAVGTALFYFRGRITLYSHRVDNPTKVRYLKNPMALGIAGLCCIATAILLVVRGW
jgi:hypothetical protein